VGGGECRELLAVHDDLIDSRAWTLMPCGDRGESRRAGELDVSAVWWRRREL
jgi:hypothetical protein